MTPWQHVVDFAVLTLVVYWLLRWGKQTRALRILVGIGSLVLLGSVASRLELAVTAVVLHAAALGAVMLLVVVYQPEIRHALTRLDLFNRLVLASPGDMAPDRVVIAEAAFSMAASRLGALIVIAGTDPLDEVVTRGVALGGLISREVLETIFRKDSPVHDGAVVIEKARIARMGTFLPLTSREDLPSQFGTRHRAAVGLAERCDATVIVVSEERGEVTLVKGPSLSKVESAADLARRIEGRPAATATRPRSRMAQRLARNWELKLASLAIAALVWTLVFATGASIRTFEVPVEFSRVPAGMELSRLSTNAVAVQLRSNAWLLGTLSPGRLVIRLDLQGLAEGIHELPIHSSDLDLPAGIELDRVSPDIVRVRLPRR
jgi:diadenylate cyclase